MQKKSNIKLASPRRPVSYSQQSSTAKLCRKAIFLPSFACLATLPPLRPLCCPSHHSNDNNTQQYCRYRRHAVPSCSPRQFTGPLLGGSQRSIGHDGSTRGRAHSCHGRYCRCGANRGHWRACGITSTTGIRCQSRRSIRRLTSV